MAKHTFESFALLVADGFHSLSMAFGLNLTDADIVYLTASVLGYCGIHNVDIYDADAVANCSAKAVAHYIDSEARKSVAKDGVADLFLAIAMNDAKNIQF